LQIKYLFISLLLLFTACSDDSISQILDKKAIESKIECMDLVVFPPHDMINKKLNQLYKFKNDCKYQLIVSYKASIVCNSNQNFDKKAMGMAKSYIRFELKQNNKLIYRYFKDLKNNLSDADVQNAFKKLKSVLLK